MPATLKWRLTTSAGLRWKHCGEHSLVFNPASGDTHLMDEVARAGLACLETGPQTGAEMCQWMRSRLELPSETDLQPYVASLLGRLRELGLVEKSPA